jgi:hypothetical protein
MAESPQGVALELTKIILAKGGSNQVSRDDYTEANVLSVYEKCLQATLNVRSGAAPTFG